MEHDIPHPAIAGTAHHVRARFADSDRLQDALAQLSMAGFDRADLSLPEQQVPSRATPETVARPADTDEDARQLRTVHSSTGAAVAAMAAVGVTLATGGGAAPAVAAAIAAGGVTGGGIFAITSVFNAGEQNTRDRDAADGTLILAVRAGDAAQQEKAASILRAAGGTDLVRF
jgi:hypothetical protein